MTPKKKSQLRKDARKIEDELGVDKGTEDLVDSILSIFDTDDDEDDDDTKDKSTSISSNDSTDDDDDDFGGGDFGGGGASSDW